MRAYPRASNFLTNLVEKNARVGSPGWWRTIVSGPKTSAGLRRPSSLSSWVWCLWEPKTVGGARLFETSYVLPQLRLFALGEAGCLTALKLGGYAPRRSPGPMALQQMLFPYLDVL